MLVLDEIEECAGEGGYAYSNWKKEKSKFRKK